MATTVTDAVTWVDDGTITINSVVAPLLAATPVIVAVLPVKGGLNDVNTYKIFLSN